MTAIELDPVFLRALRLLHSRSKDSTFQLKTMLDEAIKHRKGQGPGPLGLSPQGPKSPASPGQQQQSKSSEKRSLDRLKLELSELVVPSKRGRMDSPGFSSSKSHTPSPTPTPPGSRGDRAGNSGGSVENSSEAEDELEMDINLEGLNDCTCCICKSFNQENGNKLMECHTCQNLFHQECHSPVVSNQEANDPRLVWNCSNCSKNFPKPLSSSGNTKSSGAFTTAPKNSSSSGSSSSSSSPRTSSGKNLTGKSSGASSFKSSSGSKSNSSSTSRSFRGVSSSAAAAALPTSSNSFKSNSGSRVREKVAVTRKIK